MNEVQRFPIKSELEALMKENNVPGLSLVIIEKAITTTHIELGVKNVENKNPIDEDTIFEAASLSKPVFAYGVLKLVEAGKLDLDKPLVEYSCNPDITKDERINSITARMVLAHTTGFPNWRPKNESLKIYFQPGERFGYSGEGYLYLQKVIEHISGLSLEEYMQKNVFNFLGMEHSSYILCNNNKKAAAHKADGSRDETQTDVPQNAAFSMHTTALDYAKFVIAILKGTGLSSKMASEMLMPQIKVHEGGISSINHYTGNRSKSVSWSLGWGIQSTKNGNSFWHWGDNGGFKSFIIGSKSNNSGIIIFTNGVKGLVLISKIIKKYRDNHQPALDWLEKEYSMQEISNRI